MIKYLIVKIGFDNWENHNPIFETVIGYADDKEQANHFIANINDKKYNGYDKQVYPRYKISEIKNICVRRINNMNAPTKQANITNALAITSQNQLAVVKEWTHALNELTTTQQVNLTQAEKEFGISIITNLTDRCIKSGIKTNELNMTNFLEQVKHNSKLQLSIAEGELYLDIRNNKETGLKDVKISKQYQAIQKLLRRHCTKKVVRFKCGVVTDTDIFKIEEDFETGITKIKEHKINNEADQNDFSKINKAYAIAYIEELGNIVPYTCIIDKKRIERAKNSAITDRVWLSDTKAMVIKTAYWCLWTMMKPFIDLPVSLQESFIATDDELNFELQQDKIIESKNQKVYDIDIETAEVINEVSEINNAESIQDEMPNLPDYEEQINADYQEEIDYTNDTTRCIVCGVKLTDKSQQYYAEHPSYKRTCFKCGKK